jgi:hypothetical protein
VGVGGCGTSGSGLGVGLAHCWVLKHQAPLLAPPVRGVRGCALWAWWGLVVLVPPFVLLSPLGGGGGLVGLLFEICIVDASIN